MFVHFGCVIISPFHYTECPLDAQHLTEVLVAVEDLDLSLSESSLEAVEEILFIPTLRQLTLKVVGDYVSPLSILILLALSGRPLSLVQCVIFHTECVPSLYRSSSVISRLARGLN